MGNLTNPSGPSAFGKNLRHMGKYGRGFENTEQMFGWENGLTRAWTVGNRKSKHIESSFRVRRTNVRNICSGVRRSQKVHHLFMDLKKFVHKLFINFEVRVYKKFTICLQGIRRKFTNFGIFIYKVFTIVFRKLIKYT